MTAPAFVRCRTIGHAWDDVPNRRRPAWGVLVTLRCVSCGMLREDTVNATDGTLLNRSYVVPAGYREVGRTDRDGWRRQYVALPGGQRALPGRRPQEST